MGKTNVLWSQKANSKGGTFRNFLFFFYEFIGARFTLLAFIGLFNFAIYSLDYFGYLFAGGIALVLVYIISDAFNVFWNGINLEYKVTAEKIVFEWGVFRDHSLELPFTKITTIAAISNVEAKRKAIIFENSEQVTNRDYGISKEIYFNQLSFENVDKIEELIEILNQYCNQQVEIIPESRPINLGDRVPSSTLYSKFIQLLAFVLIYISIGIGLQLVDLAYLTKVKVQDIVVSQERIPSGKNRMHILTEKEYSFLIQSNENYVGEEVEFYASPLFKIVTKFSSFKRIYYEKMLGPSNEQQFIWKGLTFLVFLGCAIYILYCRGQVPLSDLLAVLVFPAILLFLSYGVTA